MDITKEALKLFIKSLPVGCTFAILGFGTNSQFILPQQQLGVQNEASVIWTYNDQTLPLIL